jgi:predicted  nucleic acid-binding Zn-ribbon protein
MSTSTWRQPSSRIRRSDVARSEELAMPEPRTITVGRVSHVVQRNDVEKHEQRLATAATNRTEQEERHQAGFRRQEGGRAKLEGFRQEKDALSLRIIDIAVPDQREFSDLKAKAGQLRGSNQDRAQYNAWKDELNAAFAVIDDAESRKSRLAERHQKLDDHLRDGVDGLDAAIAELRALEVKVDEVVENWRKYRDNVARGRREFLDTASNQQVAAAVRPDPRLRREYPFGGPNADPHLHQYGGDFHLQINDRGRTRRYNIVQSGARHAQADEAVRAAAGNAELSRLITNILATQV